MQLKLRKPKTQDIPLLIIGAAVAMALLALANPFLRPLAAATGGDHPIPATLLEGQDSLVEDRAPQFITVQETALVTPLIPGTPLVNRFRVVQKRRILVTAYSSTLDQTDASPFVTARGTLVRDGIVAANFLPFGAKVRFPKIWPHKVFTVEDRMHSRFSDRVDVWFATRAEAQTFGLKITELEIF
ncbi:3D domain-containing protein [Candidatus Parcubacteria bacterium]|nr:3D domain-containing protein [Candidatus Parcubacteria bacterium]